ncbi:MAG: SCO family protein [Gemmobacter sp.]|nr:SCO family protein [Gemmobacter sp.]
MTKLYAGAAAATILALLAGTALYTLYPRSDDPFADCRASVVAGGAGAIGGPFTLVDQNGTTVTERDVFTKPALVYFGYTFCPDVCPLDVARNSEAVDILEELGHEVTPVFISVDPKRDTPEVLADFAENMHPHMIALSGSEDQVKAASKAYKTFYKIQDPSEEFYLIDHSTFTYLVLPETGFAEFFRREETPDQMAARVSCYLERR